MTHWDHAGPANINYDPTNALALPQWEWDHRHRLLSCCLQNICFMLSCRIFLSLMEDAGLTGLLKQEGSYTIFAPTDEAFDGLTPSDFELLKREHPPKMGSSFLTQERLA